MEGPKRITPKGLGDYFEVLTKAVFQPGMSWKVVDAKWSGMRECLYDFDPPRVARMTPRDIARLMQDTRMIRNARKIDATVENARTIVELDRDHGGFRRYLRSHGGFEGTADDLKRRFKFLGDSGIYYFLWVTGEKVPAYEEWCKTHGSAVRHRTGRRQAPAGTRLKSAAQRPKRAAQRPKRAAQRPKTAARAKR